MRSWAKAVACTAGLTSLLAAAPASAADVTRAELARVMQLAQRANDMADIQNLMGKLVTYGSNYSLYGQELKSIMALKSPGVSYRVPTGPVGGDVVAKEFDARSKRPNNPETIHQHDIIGTPIIEIAGDGKTAKGIWSCFGADINDLSVPGNWLSIKYGADFIREDGVWKVWHVQVFPIYNTTQDKTVTQSARERLAGGGRGEGPPPGAPPPSDPRVNSAPNFKVWIYDGKTPMPKDWPKVPQPYQTFDPRDSF